MKLPRRFRAEGRGSLSFVDHNHGANLEHGSLRRSHFDVSALEGEEEETARAPHLGTRSPARFRLSSSFKESCDFDETSKEEEAEEEDLQVSERRRALFEPLDPRHGWRRDRSPSSLLPPPDFEETSYPRGWLVGKKRKLVNVDVVESMRRVAVHEMNRKDREINGLNEQLEEDSRTMEHLQMQLQQERRKRLQIERDNTILQDQVTMLMNMLNEMEETVDNGDHMDPCN